jgi:predicted transcriptional regulator
MTAGRPRKSARRSNPLLTWFKKQDSNGFSADEIARILQISRSTVYAFLDGTRVPKVHVAIRIEKMTGGAVTLASWLRNKRR